LRSEFVCPEDDCPYIRTWLNSENCSRKKIPRPTLPAIIGNHTHHWNITEEHLKNISDHVKNLTGNVTWPIFTITPWHRNLIGMSKDEAIATDHYYSSASIGWIAFGVILSMAVIATAIGGAVSYNKRRIRTTPGQERTPLLSDGRGERMY